MHRAILALAIPLILSNLTVPLLGLVNTAIVGHLHHSYYLGAVNLGAMIFDFIIWGFGCMHMSITGLVAQSLGEKDYDKIISQAVHAILLAIICALLILFLQWPIEKLAFLIIGGTEKIRYYVGQYYFMRIWATPASLINFALMGIFIGMHITKVPLLMMTLVNVVAGVLGVFFVFKLGMTVDGVALADVIGQYLGACVGLWLLYRLLSKHVSHLRFHFCFAIFKRLLGVNRDVYIRSFCLLIVFFAFSVFGTRMGALVLAVNAVLMNFFILTSYGLDGFASAAEALVGKYMGARDRINYFLAMRQTTLWAAGLAVMGSLMFIVLGHALINMITNLPAVRSLAYHYVVYAAVTPLVGVWCFQLDGIYIGANQFATMRNTMIISAIGFFVIRYVLQGYGNAGLWMALLSFFVFRSITMGWLLVRRQYFFRTYPDIEPFSK